MEAHYRLPFLSIIPKPCAHLYLRLCGKGKLYSENLSTYWRLKKLVDISNFKLIDYTFKIIDQPLRYSAEEIIIPGSFKQKILREVIKSAYWLCPTYIWLLKNKKKIPGLRLAADRTAGNKRSSPHLKIRLGGHRA